MTAVYQQESLAGLWPEITPLLERHWRELATYDDIPLDPDKTGYQALEQADRLRTYTARAAGELVAYAVFIVGGSMHYRTSRIAVQDAIYVAPEHRRGGLGAELVAYTEEQLRALGAKVVHHHQKLAHPALGALLKHAGYMQIEHIWAKRLDQPGR